MTLTPEQMRVALAALSFFAAWLCWRAANREPDGLLAFIQLIACAAVLVLGGLLLLVRPS